MPALSAGAERPRRNRRALRIHISMTKNLAIVGIQWGDEGKGKIVDILAARFDCVARYQGGHNAGHTISFGSRRHVLHLVPSGIFHSNTLCVIGGGVDLDPMCDSYQRYGDELRPYVADTASLLNRLIAEGKSILFEGAQATMLDIDHGTFPFVTSSSAAAGGVATGLGISPKHVHAIMG